jgi:hypothetical protein
VLEATDPVIHPALEVTASDLSARSQPSEVYSLSGDLRKVALQPQALAGLSVDPALGRHPALLRLLGDLVQFAD